MTNSTSNNDGHYNFYEILGVRPRAEQQEIRKAYLRLSRKVHPDKQSTEEERKLATEIFIRLKDAYDVLYDPEQRKRYDVKQRIHSAPQQQRSSNQPKWYAKSDQPKNTRADYTPNFGHRGHHPFPGAKSKSNPFEGTSPAGNKYSNSSRSRQEDSHTYDFDFGFNFNGSSYSQGQGQQQSSRNYDFRPSRNQIPPPPTPEEFAGFKSAQNSSGTGKNTSAKNKPSYSTSDKPYSSSSPKAGNSHERATTRDQPDRNRHTSSSSRHDQSSSTSTQKQHSSTRATDKDNSQSQQRQQQQPVRTFGKTLKGTDCKKCIQQGCFCHQHVHQDSTYYGGSFCKPTGNTSNGKVFGINTTIGEPCKGCQKQGNYCYRHKDQDLSSKRKKSSGVSFGRCKDGQPCKRCLKQGGFCYQHVHQATRPR